MTKPLRFDDDAVEELEIAAEWYEARRENLGLDLVAAVREALRRVAESPRTWPLVADVPEPFQVRRCLLRRFPYSVVYIELDEEIRVVAIAHTSREPGYWRKRL